MQVAGVKEEYYVTARRLVIDFVWRKRAICHDHLICPSQLLTAGLSDVIECQSRKIEMPHEFSLSHCAAAV